MFSDAKAAASAADAMQAEYFRGFLDRQQSALTDQLASLTRRLTACMTRGETAKISHVRRAIRGVEAEIHTIDRMARALTRRFPQDADVNRRA
jgi:hypothetical protein